MNHIEKSLSTQALNALANRKPLMSCDAILDIFPITDSHRAQGVKVFNRDSLKNQVLLKDADLPFDYTMIGRGGGKSSPVICIAAASSSDKFNPKN